MSTLAEQIRREADEAARKADRWQKIADLVEQLDEEGLTELAAVVKKNGNGNGHGKPRNEGDPYGREAVLRLVDERPGVWTMEEFRNAVKEHGWNNSPRSIENSVLRLVRDGEGKRLAKGRYVFPADFGEGVDDESSDSGGAKSPSLRFDV